MKRIGAIDIGTNSVRSIVVEAPSSGRHRQLDDEKAHTRLGEGLAATGRLSDEAMDRTVEALRRMVEISRSHDVDQIRAVATSAVRDAGNGDRFVARVKDELGLDIEVISEQEEGRLAFVGAAANFRLEGRVAVMDIGGGSVEIVRATGAEIESIRSLPLGAVRLTEAFVGADPLPASAFRALRRHVRDSLAVEFGAHPDPVTGLIGSGGTLTALSSMAAHLHDSEQTTAHGQEVARADVVHLLALLKRLSLEHRLSIPGLPSSRADIIVAGLCVVDEVMRLLGANTVGVNARGIREGLVLDTIAGGKAAARVDRTKALLDFGRRCRFDRKHALHVTALSLSLFDQLADTLDLDVEGRPLLEAAAILHDVGYHIAYDKHHKHSYHLISYANLAGLSGREQGMIASIARYHRGALPKAKHDAVRSVSAADRRIVEQTGALLRLADGLDRSRSQRVTSVTATRSARKVCVVAHGEGDLDVEVYGARAKGDLFERAFAVSVDVIPGPTEVATPPT